MTKATSMMVLIAALVTTLGVRAAEVDLDKCKGDLKQLCKAFPELYWYASDACLRETSQAGGHPNKREEFVATHKAVVEKVAKLGKDDRAFVMARIKLHDPKEPDEYWVFDLKTTGARWVAQGGIKRMPSGNTLNLFERDLFMGSMKPFIDQALKAHAEGKDLAKEFPKAGQP